ncbi:hypothetical protein Tco_0014991 [Tanacetum coccineum]
MGCYFYLLDAHLGEESLELMRPRVHPLMARVVLQVVTRGVNMLDLDVAVMFVVIICFDLQIKDFFYDSVKSQSCEDPSYEHNRSYYEASYNDNEGPSQREGHSDHINFATDDDNLMRWKEQLLRPVAYLAPHFEEDWKGGKRISLVVASDIVHQNICTSIQKQMAATSKATASNNRRSYVGDIGGHGIQIRRRYVAFDLLRDALSAIFGLSELKGHFRISLVVASDIVHQNICTSIQKQIEATSKATASNNRRSYVGDIGGHGIQIRRRYVRAGRAGSTNGQLEGEKYGHLQKAVSILLSSADDPNRQTRSATLTFLRSYMYINATGGPSIASIHGRVLALAACMLSVPYDMRSPLLQKQLQSSVGPMLILGAFKKIHLQKNSLRRAVNHYRLMDMKLGL